MTVCGRRGQFEGRSSEHIAIGTFYGVNKSDLTTCYKDRHVLVVALLFLFLIVIASVMATAE